MKKLLPFSLILCVSLSFCKKKDTSSSTVTTTGGTTAFVPHIDTFSGLFLTQVGEGGYTSDSMKVSNVFVNHFTSDSVTVTGDMIYVVYYDDMAGTATYGTHSMNFRYAPDSVGAYKSNPMDHLYNYISFHGDSVYISIMSEPGSCLINELQTYNGRKNP